MPSKTTSTAYYIGLMSGTSMDGIDTVLVDFSKKQPELICSHSHPFPDTLQKQLASIINPDWQGSLFQTGSLHQQLGKLFAEAVITLLKKTDISSKQIILQGETIGYVGRSGLATGTHLH